MAFQLIVRSYAPFKSFGVPPFHGDGRGPTTSAKVTSRLAAWVTFAKGTVGKADASCDETVMLGINSLATEVPKVRVDSLRLGADWLHFPEHFWPNPVLKPASPDIDLHLSFTVGLTKQHLNVNADLTGDAFPNAEVMVQDAAGARRMVYTFETSGGRRMGPIALLPADTGRRMNAICVSFPVQSEGLFT